MIKQRIGRFTYLGAGLALTLVIAGLPLRPVFAQQDVDNAAIFGDHPLYQDVIACNALTASAAASNVTSLRDKIAQMLFIRADTKAQATDAVGTYHVGGVFVTNEISSEMLSGPNIKDIESKFNPSPFFGIDEEGGKIDRLGILPSSARQMGTMTNDQVKNLASGAATKLKELGINVDFAPTVDIDNPISRAIGQLDRSFSSNPDVITEKASAFAAGLQQGGVVSTIKHFPGIGNSAQNSDGEANAATPSLDQLKRSDLIPYKKMLATNASKSWVMMNNYRVPGLTDGQPASLSKPAYDLLRGEYGFSGIAITDDLAAKSIPVPMPQAVEQTFLAGGDIALFKGADQLKSIIDYVEQQANANPELKTKIDASSSKIIAYKASLGTLGDAAASPANSGSCSCNAASQLTGSNGEQQTWNFFISKGMTPVQAAGALGNVKVESASKFDPRQLEIGYSPPPHLWDKPLELPPYDPRGDPARGGAGQPGIGIVQWTSPGRKKGLLDAAKASQAQSIIDLGVQLDFLWSELQGPYKQSALDPILRSTDLAEVVHLWQDHYEVGTAFEPRFAAAQAYMLQYGSSTASTPSTPTASGGSSSCSTTGQQGPTGGTFSWPEPVANTQIFQCFTWSLASRSGHPGLDISGGPDGVPIFAAADGTVVFAGNSDTDRPNYGPNFVILKHANGFGTSYGHMRTMSVKVGDQVRQGQQIGEQGNLGNSAGSHLHFNVFPGDYSGGDGPNVDPLGNGLSLPSGVINPKGCQ